MIFKLTYQYKRTTDKRSDPIAPGDAATYYPSYIESRVKIVANNWQEVAQIGQKTALPGWDLVSLEFLGTQV